MEQTEQWIKVVAVAMKRLTPEHFQQWIVLVGGGYDNERAVKGERFLEMMRPTTSRTEYVLNLFEGKQP